MIDYAIGAQPVPFQNNLRVKITSDCVTHQKGIYG
jgi:hypothetical protein